MKTKSYKINYDDNDVKTNFNDYFSSREEIYQYDTDDQLRYEINVLKDLKEKGYTHVKDKFYTMLTGSELCPVDMYIIDTSSYLSSSLEIESFYKLFYKDKVNDSVFEIISSSSNHLSMQSILDKASYFFGYSSSDVYKALGKLEEDKYVFHDAENDLWTLVK